MDGFDEVIPVSQSGLKSLQLQISEQRALSGPPPAPPPRPQVIPPPPGGGTAHFASHYFTASDGRMTMTGKDGIYVLSTPLRWAQVS
jgi:hypothetical protein